MLSNNACAGSRGWEVVDGESKSNQGEAAALIEVVAQLLEAGDTSIGEIGVVTPYATQVRAHLGTYDVYGRVT